MSGVFMVQHLGNLYLYNHVQILSTLKTIYLKYSFFTKSYPNIKLLPNTNDIGYYLSTFYNAFCNS